MSRRRGRGRRRRRGGVGSGSIIKVPFVQQVDEGKTAVFSFNHLFGKQLDVFKSVPWRVTGVFVELARANDINDPAIVQFRLNNAMSPNVEGITSRRVLVTPGSVRRLYLRARAPNPWKEEEQKSQNILEIDNIKFGTGSVPNQVGFNMVMTFQFGPLVWPGYDTSDLIMNRGRIVDRSAPASPFATMSEDY